MSQDDGFNFEQHERSEFELTSNFQSYAECNASCSNSMEYHSSDSVDKEQLYNMQKGQEEDEIVFNSLIKPITPRLRSMEYPIGISDDDDEQIDNNMKYLMDTCAEGEPTDHLETGQNGNVMVSDDQLKSIPSCSKSVEYNSSDISDKDVHNESISMGHEGNETVVLNELDEKGVNNNLPTGWIKLNHASGRPVYFNKDMNVCSFSKPYYLRTQSLKNHNVPVESLPCLEHKLKLKKMDSQKKDDDKWDYDNKYITPEQYKTYCEKLFKFKADQSRKDLPKFKDRSTLIAVPVDPPVMENTALPDTGEWIVNLNNKSYISILHEYVKRVLKTQLSYTFKKHENASAPYLATVILDGIKYGIGIGSSKKKAKLDSAKATMEILLPSAKDQINRTLGITEMQVDNVFNEYKVFDQLIIKDPRIPRFCVRAAKSMPYDILQICVKRNFGEDINIETDKRKMQRNTGSEILYSLTMKVKKHMATVVCKNKSEGHQKGAQALLKVIHPHIIYFGSLLRLYSHQNVGSSSEKKSDEPGNQSTPLRVTTNQDMLHQLKTVMAKLERECTSSEEETNHNSICKYANM